MCELVGALVQFAIAELLLPVDDCYCVRCAMRLLREQFVNESIAPPHSLSRVVFDQKFLTFNVDDHFQLADSCGGIGDNGLQQRLKMTDQASNIGETKQFTVVM